MHWDRTQQARGALPEQRPCACCETCMGDPVLMICNFCAPACAGCAHTCGSALDDGPACSTHYTQSPAATPGGVPALPTDTALQMCLCVLLLLLLAVSTSVACLGSVETELLLSLLSAPGCNAGRLLHYALSTRNSSHTCVQGECIIHKASLLGLRYIPAACDWPLVTAM